MSRKPKQFLTPEDVEKLKAVAYGIFPNQSDLAAELLDQVMIPSAKAASAKKFIDENNPVGLVKAKEDAIREEWDRDAICALLIKSDKAVVKALKLLLSKQTVEEQDHYITTEANGQGFTQFDAEFYTAMAKVTMERGLSPKQIGALRKLNKAGRPSIGKYWRQIQDEIVIQKLAA